MVKDKASRTASRFFQQQEDAQVAEPHDRAKPQLLTRGRVGGRLGDLRNDLHWAAVKALCQLRPSALVHNR